MLAKLTHSESYEFFVKGKGIPHYRPWRPMGDVDSKVHILSLANFTPGTHFIGVWVDPRTSLEAKEWRNSPRLWHPGLNPGCPACSQAPYCLRYLVHMNSLWLGLYDLRAYVLAFSIHFSFICFYVFDLIIWCFWEYTHFGGGGEAKGNWNFWDSDLVKNPDETDI